MVAPLVLLGGASLLGGLGFLAGSSGSSGGSEFKLFDKVAGNDTNTSTTLTDQRQIDNSKKYQKTINTTNTVTDNRSLILTLNSPNAVTKKADKTSPEVSSAVTPSLTTPTQFGNPVSTPISNSERSTAGSGSSGSGSFERLILIGGAVAGGVLLLNNYTKGGKK